MPYNSFRLNGVDEELFDESCDVTDGDGAIGDDEVIVDVLFDVLFDDEVTVDDDLVTRLGVDADKTSLIRCFSAFIGRLYALTAVELCPDRDLIVCSLNISTKKKNEKKRNY